MKGKVYNEKTGKWISGGALQLHIIKENGGWERHHRQIIEEAYEIISSRMENKIRRKPMRRIK